MHCKYSRQRPGDVVDETVPGVFAAPERNIVQSFNRAQKALKENRFGEALEGLGEILGRTKTVSFSLTGRFPSYKSLKGEAQQLWDKCRPKAANSTKFAAGARPATNSVGPLLRDAALLSEISARLFHTQAGYEATYLLALDQMDYGSPLAGCLP